MPSKDSCKDYIAAYRRLHEGHDGFLVDGERSKPLPNLFDGSNFVTKLYRPFCAILENVPVARILDYGSGKADHLHKTTLKGKTLYQAHPGKIQTYYCFDPGYTRFSKPPAEGQTFNIVICADVMEHVPEEDVRETLVQIRSKLEDGGVALFTISGKLAKKSFLDGENLHVTVKPYTYWRDLINEIFTGCGVYLIYEGQESSVTSANGHYQRLAGEV